MRGRRRGGEGKEEGRGGEGGGEGRGRRRGGEGKEEGRGGEGGGEGRGRRRGGEGRGGERRGRREGKGKEEGREGGSGGREGRGGKEGKGVFTFDNNHMSLLLPLPSPPLLVSPPPSSIHAFVTETVEATWNTSSRGGGGGRNGGTEGEDGAREAVHPTRVVESVSEDLLGPSAAGTHPTCSPPRPLCPSNQEI